MLKKYLLNTSGNFSIMFSVAITMLLLGVGAAIDISGAISQKSTAQSLSDAAVLAAVSSGETDPKLLEEIVRKSITANNLDGLKLDWDLKIDGTTVSINLNSTYNTQLMGVFGKDELPVSVLSEALVPEDVPINIALVLDRTGSMEGANMSALKAASNVLIDQFSNYSAETQVAVVPFSNYVNVGLSRRNEIWIDVPPNQTVFTPAGPCYSRQFTTCLRREDVTQTRIVDGVSRTRVRNQCAESVNDGPPREFCPPARTETVEWNGCIGSRDGVYNQTAAYNNKAIPGILGVDCGEEVLPLTRDLNSVKTRINSLTASKETYIPVGLVNGWRMLNPEQPFDEFSNADPDRRRTLILMTDGANTLSLEKPYTNGKHCNGANEDDNICRGIAGVEGTDHTNTLTATLCENIKQDNIDIWSVAYNFDGADTKATLRACASNPSQYFDASDRAELIAAFENIGNKLFSVRLTR